MNSNSVLEVSSRHGLTRDAQVVESGAVYEEQGTHRCWIVLTILETKCQSKEKSLVVMPWPVKADSQIKRIDKKKPTQTWLNLHTKIGNLLTDGITAANAYITKLHAVITPIFYIYIYHRLILC